MSVTLKELEAEALKLPLKDRAELAEHLIESLDNISSKAVTDVFRDAYAGIK